jgi:hypothetical protein
LRLKSAFKDGTTHIVMEPLEFMERLAALVPRPRLHLIRFHGVLAPNAKLRREIVPSPSQQATSEEPKTGCQREPTESLALSLSERCDLEHFAPLRPLRCPSRPKQHRDFHQAQRELTTLSVRRYCSGQKKRWFKIPIQLCPLT